MNTEGQITSRHCQLFQPWLENCPPRGERRVRAETFREADEALQANGDAEQAAGIREETEEYHRLNGRVNDLWPAVPWWVRAPALPHPGTRRGAALYVLAAVTVLAVTVMIALSLSGCHVGWPCDNHGGVKWTNGKLYQCNDGTWE